MESTFDYCIGSVSKNLKAVLRLLPSDIRNGVQEIRIRNGLPLAVTVGGKNLYILNDGQTSYIPKNAYICKNADIEESFMIITKHSVYARVDEIKEGFIRMNRGCRAGICGSFSEKGMIFDVSGINIRIAKEYIGCADSVMADYRGGGILILGPPGSGKTTVLRDILRQISNGGRRVAVIDSRGEISASSYGVSAYDLGVNTDTYIIADKKLGIQMALRTMFPQVIGFDEIGTMEEVKRVVDGFNAGVDIITTAHIGAPSDIKNRAAVCELIDSGAIGSIYFLDGKIGKKPIMLKKGEGKYDYRI